MKAMIKALIWAAAAFFFGFVVFSSIKTMFGYDSDIIKSNAVSDRLILSKQIFMDRSDEYQTIAAVLRDYEGIQILRSPQGTPVIVWEGARYQPEELFDQATASSIELVFEDSELPAEYETDDGSTIDDLRVYNIASSSGSVLFYMYYGENDTIAVAYDGGEQLTQDNGAITIIDEWEIYLMSRETAQ